jgi:glycyl-tRNA synthetase (class II)
VASDADQAATVRERDSTKQERIGIDGLTGYLSDRMAGC